MLVACLVCLCVLETNDTLFHCYRNETLKPKLILVCWIPCSLFPKPGGEVYWHMWSIVHICIYFRLLRNTSIFVLWRLCPSKTLITALQIEQSNTIPQFWWVKRAVVIPVLHAESVWFCFGVCFACINISCLAEQLTWARLLDSAWDMQPGLILEFSCSPLCLSLLPETPHLEN